MKSGVKDALWAALTMIAIALVIAGLGYLTRPVKTDKSLKTIQTFHALKENSLDVIGFGSSHMWHGLDTPYLYEKYGIKGYNFGCNWQHINTTCLFVEDALFTQSPKVAVIDTGRVNDLLQDENMDGEIYYTRGLKLTERKMAYLKQCFGDDKERYLSYVVPLSTFHENWINLEKESFVPNLDYDFSKEMGFHRYETVASVTPVDQSSVDQIEIDRNCIAVLDDIVSMCREKNAQVLFITIPYADAFPYSASLEQYASEHDCAYLNLFDHVEEMGIDENTDFFDNGHLNANGADKVTDYLGNYLLENYDF